MVVSNMTKDKIIEVGADEDRVAELMESETIEQGGKSIKLSEIIGDIQTAHKELDEYKEGSLSLAQSLSEASDEADDEVLKAILADMSDGAFGVYLRLHRGDLELMGGRDGEYSGHLTE